MEESDDAHAYMFEKILFHVLLFASSAITRRKGSRHLWNEKDRKYGDSVRNSL